LLKAPDFLQNFIDTLRKIEIAVNLGKKVSQRHTDQGGFIAETKYPKHLIENTQTTTEEPFLKNM